MYLEHGKNYEAEELGGQRERVFERRAPCEVSIADRCDHGANPISCKDEVLDNLPLVKVILVLEYPRLEVAFPALERFAADVEPDTRQVVQQDHDSAKGHYRAHDTLLHCLGLGLVYRVNQLLERLEAELVEVDYADYLEEGELLVKTARKLRQRSDGVEDEEGLEVADSGLIRVFVRFVVRRNPTDYFENPEDFVGDNQSEQLRVESGVKHDRRRRV